MMAYKPQGPKPRIPVFHQYRGKLDTTKVLQFLDHICDGTDIYPSAQAAAKEMLGRCISGEFYSDAPCRNTERRMQAIYDTLDKTIDVIDALSPNESSLRTVFPQQVQIEEFMGEFIGHISPSVLKVGPLDPMVMRRGFHSDNLDSLLSEMEQFVEEQLEILKRGKCACIGAPDSEAP